jgi:hypothetical protein
MYGRGERKVFSKIHRRRGDKASSRPVGAVNRSVRIDALIRD